MFATANTFGRFCCKLYQLQGFCSAVSCERNEVVVWWNSNWSGVRGIWGDWIVRMPALPQQPPITNAYPLTSLPWQLTPTLNVEIRGSKCVWVCARMTMAVLCGLYGDCVTVATARAIVMNPKTVSLRILFLPSHRFVTVCSLSCFPPFLLSSVPPTANPLLSHPLPTDLQ